MPAVHETDGSHLCHKSDGLRLIEETLVEVYYILPAEEVIDLAGNLEGVDGFEEAFVYSLGLFRALAKLVLCQMRDLGCVLEHSQKLAALELLNVREFVGDRRQDQVELALVLMPDFEMVQLQLAVPANL